MKDLANKNIKFYRKIYITEFLKYSEETESGFNIMMLWLFSKLLLGPFEITQNIKWLYYMIVNNVNKTKSSEII